jgi:uncharacterized membrane protein
MWEWVWVAIGAALVALAAGILLRRRLLRFGREVYVERARESFRLQRQRLLDLFLPAAAATGKPRGLKWRDCTFDDEVYFARDRQSGDVVALVGTTIRFEAIPGGGMEGVAAVGNPRTATAVFFFHRGNWHTVGKAVFNLQPREALEHFSERYESIDMGSTS